MCRVRPSTRSIPWTSRSIEEVNEVVQEEPADVLDPETAGLLASIGIEKGKPFAPDARMKKILTEAAAVGQATARALAYRTRLEEAQLYPDSAWETAFVGGSHEFLSNGARLLDARSFFFFYATGITPAMAQKDGRRRLTVRSRLRGLQGSTTGRRQDLSPASATEHPCEGLLVARRVRQPDALAAADRSAVPQYRQSEERAS